MDSYTPLLEKTRLPQPSLQKLAVISLFEKFRSASPSSAGHDAISRCLRSASSAVVDQSARELCRLVKDSKFDISTALLELHSALEDSPGPQLASVLIKAIGLLTRLGFQKNPSSFRFRSSELHPFVKILCCGAEIQSELLRQVVLFIVKCKHLGMDAVSEFLASFVNHSIIKLPASSASSVFMRNMVSTMATFCCSFPGEALPIIQLFTGRLKYLPCKNAEEVANASYVMECVLNAYIVVLRQLVEMGLLVHEAQLCGLALLDAILSKHLDLCKSAGELEKFLDVSRHLLAVQKELGLPYITEISSLMLLLFTTLVQSELEHEQYTILNFVLFLLRWKSESEDHNATTSELREELLFIFPVLALVSSPSRSIKQIATGVLTILGKKATNLLIAPMKKQVGDGMNLSISTPGHIVYKGLRNIWFEDQMTLHGSLYVKAFLDSDVYVKEEQGKLRSWTSSVREHYLKTVEMHKSASSIVHSAELFPSEMPQIVCAMSCVSLLHQMGNSAVDLLAIGSNVDAKLGVPLLLVVLFYSHIFSSAKKDKDCHEMLLKLLSLLPSLASQPAMIPLVLQVLLPMLHKDANHVIKATAIRLICKTWEINDRIFGSLQPALHPSGLAVQLASERAVCISIAVSVRDVCKRNPDRGVDLILSVAACIENNDPSVQSIGFQSLAHLCEADVIDFYTAWDVISKHVKNYLGNASVAHGLSCLLRWGAMDAQAYPEAAKNILNILWDIGNYKDISQGLSWIRARDAAFSALLQYEVVLLQNIIPEFSSRNLELLISLSDLEALPSLEEFEVKVINFEHISRRRFVKHRRVPRSKIVKLLDVVPDVIFSSGHDQRIKELPGAALLSFPTHKSVKNLRGLRDVLAKYEDAAMEISGSLQLSRNILLALFSVQSWKPFMHRWMRSCIMVLDAKTHPTMLDKTSKAANEILKVITRSAEAAIPRSAENIALSLGAYCLVLPASAHTVKAMASRFLLNGLSQYEHEYRQWSAAISLGLISSCLHMTDHKQKYANINALIEVASNSKSSLVKGACGIGLGFSCQDLLTRAQSGANTDFEKDKHEMYETELLKRIIRSLVQMIYHSGGSSSGILVKLATYFPLGTDDFWPTGVVEFMDENTNNLEDDSWGIAGPIIGLGYSLGALYRTGAHDAVLYLKSLIMSWIPGVNISFSNSRLSETCLQMSSLGACLALPTIVSFCQKVELIDDVELDHLLSGLTGLMSELLSFEQFDIFDQSLLMASCAGAGSILSIVSDARLQSLDVEHVKGFLSLLRRAYSGPNPPLVHLGGMLGIVNVMGSGAGTLLQITTSDHKDSSSPGQLLSNHFLETEATSLVQEIFLVAQSSEDPQLQHYAAWSISFLRHFIFSRAHSNDESSAPVRDGLDVIDSAPQAIPEDSLVMRLSMWLMQINFLELGTRINIGTVNFALRCLSHAPRVPSLDWGAIVRRCMKYGGQVANTVSHELATRNRTLREECFLFSLSHANQSDSLLGFLDELLDFARLKSTESDLQSSVLLHLGDLLKIFSNSRVMKLFDDVVNFLHWVIFSDKYNKAQKMSIRVCCWKGLQICLNDPTLETQNYLYNLEHCMEVLFALLPCIELRFTEESYALNVSVEWTESIKCLGKARKSWVTELLLIPDASFKEVNHQKGEVQKKLLAKVALVRTGSMPLLELTKLRAYVLDIDPEVIWNILLEVTVTLQHTDESVRRQWLVDTAEILCVTRYPSTVLRFLGLLSGSCCKFMLVLVVDKRSVLSDLPVTLSSLLGGTGWKTVAEPVVSCLCKSIERLHDWAKQTGLGNYMHSSQPIDPTETDDADFLLQVMHETCVALKEYLPADKQLRLANMFIT